MKKTLQDLNIEATDKNLNINELRCLYKNVYDDRELFALTDLNEKMQYASLMSEYYLDLQESRLKKSDICKSEARKYMIFAVITVFLFLISGNILNISQNVYSLLFGVTLGNLSVSIANKITENIYYKLSLKSSDRSTYYNIFYKNFFKQHLDNLTLRENKEKGEEECFEETYENTLNREGPVLKRNKK